MSNDVLSFSNVSYAYSAGPLVLKDISFHLGLGESLGIIGPNGGGKSTLLKLIAGLLKPSAGEVHLAPKQIAYVPQLAKFNSILPLSVREVVGLDGQNKTDISEAIKLVGLEGKETRLFPELSGGEKQRTLLARALSKKPQILLLDEPHSGLDSTGQDQLIGIIKNLQEQKNLALVIVDHNIAQVIEACDKILCLNKTSHWHDHKDMLSKNVLQNIYHCEFEHLLIHESEHAHEDHHLCHTHGHSHISPDKQGDDS